MLGRSTNMIIGILGILKSGGAYVPIDPEYPIDRINQLIEDSGIEILITSGSISRESDFKGEIIDIDRKELKELSIQFAIEPSNSSALAYVMYTSGSTGKPKGVEIEHKSVVRLVKNNKFFPFNSEHKILQTGAPVFDATTFEIWGALLNGGMLYVPKNETIISAEKLEECIKGKNITTIWLTSSLFTQLVDLSDEIFDELNFLLVGGDVLSVKHINKIRRRNPKLIIINGYGPTENTTFSTTFNIEKEYNTNIPIGKPISNSIAYIFNSKNKVQPIGVSGELLLGGDGLARDYLNNPKLTSDKFIENPYKKGERLYRTGDIARWLSDGNIEFIGRIDNQVKIRGYRIELGEVEFVINKLDEVRKGFVDVNISKQIVAYVVLEKEVSIDELRQKVSQKLPSYMIPSYFVKLEEFPLTTNGKIDRKALPEPEKNTEEEYIAPRNDLEKKLVDIWSSVLGIENVGINDNFFNLGGDSIKTIQIQARLNKEGYILSVKDIFVNPTISSLVPKISVKTNVICQDFVSGEVKLTPIQQYFFSDKKDINHFNQSVLLRSESRLEEDKVEKMFSKLLQHHDALRIVCTLKNDQYSLYNNAIEDASISLKVYDLRNENNPDERINEYANQIQRSIDIINGPLLKLGLFHLEDSDRLLIVIHHLVVDGISWRILFEDIETLYDQVEKGETLKLPLKSNSFKDWSQKLIEYSESPKLLEEKDYWSEVTNKEIPSLNCDINDENFEDNELEIMHFSLDKDYTSLLLKKTNAVYSTDINDILICGLGDAVKKTFGNEKIMVSLEGHGREEIITDIDISRTLGWFTTIYPIVLDMEYSEDLSMQIKMVKESLHQIPEKGIGYGVLKYLTPKSLREGIQFNKEPQIEFNYLGQFGSDIQQMTQFSIASEKSGDSISPDRKASFDFSFGGMIAEGELTISVRFKKKYYSSKLVSELMINYKESLLRIIDHCINAISSKDKKLINQLIMEDEIVDFSDEITI